MLEEQIHVLMRIASESTPEEKETINPFIERYQQEYQRMTGQPYHPHPENIIVRMNHSLRKYLTRDR